MNNKQIGTGFENRMCELLNQMGYWVHFITPDAKGAQPFDIIAVKNGIAHAIDCKTCASDRISISRLEDNQIMAFEKWIRCGNPMPKIAVEYAVDGHIYLIPYCLLKQKKTVKVVEGRYFA